MSWIAIMQTPKEDIKNKITLYEEEKQNECSEIKKGY